MGIKITVGVLWGKTVTCEMIANPGVCYKVVTSASPEKNHSEASLAVEYWNAGVRPTTLSTHLSVLVALLYIQYAYMLWH